MALLRAIVLSLLAVRSLADDDLDEGFSPTIMTSLSRATYWEKTGMQRPSSLKNQLCSGQTGSLPKPRGVRLFASIFLVLPE